MRTDPTAEPDALLDRARSAVRAAVRRLPPGTGRKALLAAVVAAMLAPVAAPLVAGVALNPFLAAAGGLLGKALADVGSSKVTEFLKRFCAAQQDCPPDEVEGRLRTALTDELTRDGADAAALRAEVSQLLHDVGAIETAIQAASDDIRAEIADAVDGLAAEFAEFRLLVADVRTGLEEVLRMQQQQLALQVETAELQRLSYSKLNLLVSRSLRPARVPVAPDDADGRDDGDERDDETDDGVDLATPERDPAPCPYQGLLPYQAHDADRFFGRDRLVAELVTRLSSARFLAVLGPSGSGKSSVVRAGLLPRIGTAAVAGSADWPAPVVFSPGPRALEQLAVSLGSRRPTHDGVTVRAALLEDPEAIRVLVGQELTGDAEQVIVVDQFEEVFTQQPDSVQRRTFVDALVAASADGSRARVVIALRADHLGECTAHPELLRLVQDHQVLVGPMTDEELRAAVEQPAEHAGFAVDPRLVQLVVDDVRGEPGALPLLSHALAATWERRSRRRLTVEGYLGTGGVRGAIAETADAVYGQLDSDHRRVARALLLRLTNASGDVPTRVRVDRAELLSLGGEPERIQAVVDALVAARLVTVEQDTVQVAHEAVLREWKQLRGWIDEDRLGLALRHDLSQRARAWDRGGRTADDLLRGARLAASLELVDRAGDGFTDSEVAYVDASRAAQRQELADARRRTRRFQVVAAITTVLALLAAGLAVAVRRQGDATAAAAALAQVRRLAAESAAVADRDPSLSALLAVEASARGPDVDEAARRLASVGVQSPPRRRTIVVDRRVIGVAPVVDRLVTYEARPSTAGPVVVIRDPATGEVRREIAAPNGAFASDDSSAAVVVGTDVWRASLTSGETSRTRLAGSAAPESVALSSNARFVVAVDDGALRSWEVATGESTSTPVRLRADPAALAVSDDGDRIAALLGDGTLGVFDRSGEETWHSDVGEVPIALAFNGSGSRIAAAASFGTLLFSAVDGQQIGAVPRGSDVGSKIAFSQDDSTIAIAADGSVGRWSATTLTGLGSPTPLGSTFAMALAFGPSSSDVVVVTDDEVITQVDFAGAGDPSVLFPPVVGVVVPPSATADGSVAARYVEGALQIRRADDEVALGGGPGSATAVALDPAGERAAVGSAGSTVWIYELMRRSVTTVELPDDTASVRALSFSPDGSTIAVTRLTADGSAVDVLSSAGSVRWSLPPDPASPVLQTGPTWTPEGHLAVPAIVGDAWVLRILEAGGGSEVATERLGDVSTKFPSAVRFDGSRMAIVWSTGELEVRDPRSTTEPVRVSSTAGFTVVGAFAFDDDTGSAVAADLRGRIVGWDVSRGTVLFGPIPVQQASANAIQLSLSFPSQGAVLLLGDLAGGLRRVPWGRAAWQQELCDVAGRNLSRAEWQQYLPPDEPYRTTCAQYPAGS